MIIDLVLSHTSDQHPWFKESRTSRDNPKADWYVWADAKPDGTPPNNWLSIFGGPAWEWDGQRMQYYMHNFLKEQPDLNFHCRAVQDELLAVARFWLERGVDGFRLDTVNFYVHDQQLRDNPPLKSEEVSDKTAPSVNPYSFQNHKYDKSRPENLDFLARLRGVMNEFQDITSVGEVGDDQRGLEIQGEYTAGNERLHMCYGFEFLSNPFPTGHRIAEVLNDFQDKAAESWACWAFSNHDVKRHTSRWNLTPDAQRLYLALLLSLRGTACLYQGEELGLTEAYVPYEDLQDPYGKRFWPKFKGRDGCRTPFPWSHDQLHGGFSEGKPWLPVAMEHIQIAAEVQDHDPDSMLKFYRRVCCFRHENPVLRKGSLELIEATESLISFTREHGNVRVFCAFNLSTEECGVELPAGSWAVNPEAPFEFEQDNTTVTLPAWQAVYAFAGA